jgi:proteic killer suppression protein
MLIRSIRHKGLKRFVENNDARGIRPDMIERARNILAVLISAENMEGVNGPPGWRIHQLSGDRRGTWSISITGNWRITFEAENNEIINLDLEDYH